MKGRKSQGQTEHDAVVEASGRTYAGWAGRGYVVATNPGGSKNGFVGPSNNLRYPDIVVWRPSTPGASTGTVTVNRTL